MLKEFERVGMILDMTHLRTRVFSGARIFAGPSWPAITIAGPWCRATGSFPTSSAAAHRAAAP